MGKDHICLAALKNTTIEHLLVVRDQARSAGLSVCTLDLPPSMADLDPVAINGVNNLVDAGTPEALEAHMRAFRPLGVWLATPYPEHYPSWFLDMCQRLPTVYSGYGLHLSDYRSLHFETPLIASANFLIPDSDYAFAGYTRHANRAKIVFSGNPLLFTLRQALPWSKPIAGTVLWAPHWTVSGSTASGYGCWSQTIGPLSEWIRQNPDARVLIRPHPILRQAWRRILNSDTDGSSYAQLVGQDTEITDHQMRGLRALLSADNVEVSNKTMLSDILRSSVLLADGVSMLGYYAATGKPMLVLRTDKQRNFNPEMGRLIESLDFANPGALYDWLSEELPRGSGPNKQRIAACQDTFPTFSRSPIEIWRNLSTRERSQ